MSRLTTHLALATAVLLGSGHAGLAQGMAAHDAQPLGPAAPVRHARTHRHHAPRHVSGVAPVAPAPAQNVASNTSPAPVPNEAVSPPDTPAPAARIAPSVFQLHYPPVGEGYVTGSSSQAMDDREAAKATGVQMTVPLPH